MSHAQQTHDDHIFKDAFEVLVFFFMYANNALNRPLRHNPVTSSLRLFCLHILLPVPMTEEFNVMGKFRDALAVFKLANRVPI